MQRRLVGRDGQLDALGAWLREGARLITVTGPPGVGKSALAAAATASLPGVVRCAARQAADRDDLHRHLAAQLGLNGADPTALGRALREVRLLVIDDAEALVATLPDLLTAGFEAAPDLQVLITSRLPLGLAAERCMALDPLTPAHAAALFSDLARTWAPEAPDARHVQAVVERLGGLPLALVMAARRLELIDVAQLAARLDNPLPLLAGPGDSGAPHGSFRAAMDASWRLLPPEAQRAFAALSLPGGPFTLADLEHLLGAQALDALHTLQRHSLLQPSAGPGPRRFQVLPLLRHDAAERLSTLAAGTQLTLRRRHAQRVLARAPETQDEAALRAVARWALDREGDEATEVALQAAVTLCAVYARQGPRAAAVPLLKAALARPDGPPALRAQALHLQAALA
ncbi:MAG: AAA family ATPase, partial [Myxococcales bacterium]|nr:AAA family ATPase [Myxococcales bacterium]